MPVIVKTIKLNLNYRYPSDLHPTRQDPKSPDGKRKLANYEITKELIRGALILNHPQMDTLDTAAFFRAIVLALEDCDNMMLDLAESDFKKLHQEFKDCKGWVSVWAFAAPRLADELDEAAKREVIPETSPIAQAPPLRKVAETPKS